MKKRVLAVIALMVIVLCLAGLIVSAFSGAGEDVMLAFLFLLIVVPSVIFIFIKFTDTLTGSRRDDDTDRPL